MPKLKTRKSLIKRFRITKKGKIIRSQSFGRHLKAHKSKKRLRALKRPKQLKGFYAKKILKATGMSVRTPKKHGKSKINRVKKT